ncbi:hypothetical protein FKM82_022213 [Ascaphus truei]
MLSVCDNGHFVDGIYLDLMGIKRQMQVDTNNFFHMGTHLVAPSPTGQVFRISQLQHRWLNQFLLQHRWLNLL